VAQPEGNPEAGELSGYEHNADEAAAHDHAESAAEVHGHPVTLSHGQEVIHVPREALRELVGALRSDGFLQCLDVTAVDYLAYPAPRDLPDGIAEERFELIVTLISHGERRRLRLRVQVPESDPTCPSLFELFPGTEALEREVFDMFGITFTDHPDMTRILMPEDWIGHPLRRDYSVGDIPVKFKGAAS
jgi:NADH:ubiquinone oxidoreductase subunit C